MTAPIITKRPGGEYSTAVMPSGHIETCWFGDDGSSKVIGITGPLNVAILAAEHIDHYENG